MKDLIRIPTGRPPIRRLLKAKSPDHVIGVSLITGRNGHTYWRVDYRNKYQGIFKNRADAVALRKKLELEDA